MPGRTSVMPSPGSSVTILTTGGRMKKWTAADIHDQTGKTAIVTGANSGIGFAAARDLAIRGCRVILACRNLSKAQDAKERIEKAAPGADVEVAQLDLSSLKSVREFAGKIVESGKPLDLLVNNAAVMALPKRQTTADGFEMQFGTNHLGHFALTGLLLPAILAAKAARVVTVASIAHLNKKLPFDDLQSEKKYHAWNAYGQTKLANLMFSLELDRRFRHVGATAISIAVHPGLSKTSIIQNGPGASGGLKNWFIQASFAMPRTIIRSGCPANVVRRDIRGRARGKYYGPDGFSEWRGYPAEAKTSREARDETAAQKLWEISEQLTGVQVPNSGTGL